MFLAALFVADEIGFALVARFMFHPVQIQQRLVDARDSVKQIILTTAILSGCTFRFIEELVVKFCAHVDPDPMRNVLSPLQAAALRGRKDVTSLLISHGALDNSTHSDQLSTSYLARYRGHTDIETLIFAKTFFKGGNIPG
jgi:hypothetical protein